jgi:aminoglycoside phosphotransferase (APT) family kinase protein
VGKTQLHCEQDVPWLKLGADACHHARISFDSLEVLSTWDRGHSSNAVYKVNRQFFLKLYGPNVLQQFHVERTLLEALAEREDIPSPDIVAVGEPSDALPYLIITQIPGSTAEVVWDEVPRREQLTIAEELGEIVAAINGLPRRDLASVERRFGGRREFASHWRARLIERIKATDTVSAQSRAAFVEFFESEARKHIDDGKVVTHRELAHNHIYLDRQDGVWCVSGIIDWADAMLGPEEWDVSFIWFWTFTRDHEAMGRFLTTRFGEDGLPDGLARRCLGAILQTYEGPDLWEEFVQRHEGSQSDPVGVMTSLLFPADVFG